jgi:spore germination cell wall hydrolase CwlJ-like protein
MTRPHKARILEKAGLRYVAGTVNIAVLCAVIAVGAFHWSEAQAQERLRGISDEDRHCLAQNIFFESRNQSIEGQVAVAWVTINRMTESQFPITICAVVKQGRKDANGNMKRNQCQFSWYCDGKSDRIPNTVIAQRAWEDAQLIANVVLIDWATQEPSPVDNATFYHADYVNPYWAAEFTEVAVVDDHIFYVN